MKNMDHVYDALEEGLIAREVPGVPGRKPSRAFSLVELLVVIAVIALLAALSGPAIRSIAGAGTVNKAIGDLSGHLQNARAYAMATHTYVRVAIAPNGVTTTSGSLNPASMFLSLVSTDGTLDAVSANDMANSTNSPKWATLGKALVLDNLLLYDTINGSSPNTSADTKPSDSDIPDFARNVGGRSVNFTGCIQFDPAGEARVEVSNPTRYIKIAIDKPSPSDASTGLGQNPFILRLSGINGAVMVLRKGEGI